MTTESKIRNVCILAHVDHGKTTLADTILATNNIVSSKMTGKLRFMDSLDIEQERGITMKSSVVNMQHEGYDINLVDSPGHIDFASEVSTAVRLSDGAIIIVDLVEGICPQTRTVLKQALDEGLSLVLFLNKMDRLIFDLKQTPDQACDTITAIIEQFNSLIAEYFNGKAIKMAFDKDGELHLPSWFSIAEHDEEDDGKMYFDPDRGNVVFGASVDNWGFRIVDFARIWAEKLKIPQEMANSALWGDSYLTNAGQVKEGARDKGRSNAFTSCILTQIWTLYEKLLINKEFDRLQAITASIKVNLTPRELKMANNDARAILRLVMSKWLPLGQKMLQCVVEHMTPPEQSFTRHRSLRLIYGDQININLEHEFLEEKPFVNAICQSAKQAPLIGIVTKTFWVKKAKIHDPTEEFHSRTSSSSKEPIALARVFSGCLEARRKVFILGPKWDCASLPHSLVDANAEDFPTGPLEGVKHISVGCLLGISRFPGGENDIVILPRDELVPPGSIVGLVGVELVYKSALLVDSLSLVCKLGPLTGLAVMYGAPLLSVSVELAQAKHYEEYLRLEDGLKALTKADSCAEFTISSQGEFLLHVSGEVHLQKCLDSLRKDFAPGIEMDISDFIVPYRETILAASAYLQDTGGKLSSKPVDLQNVYAILQIPECKEKTRFFVRVTAHPMPEQMLAWLEQHKHTLKLLLRNRSLIASLKVEFDQLCYRLQEEKISSPLGDTVTWHALGERLLAFAPHNTGPNVLFCNLQRDYLNFQSLWQESAHLSSHTKAILQGFQLACEAGPICSEPLRGVIFLLEEIFTQSAASSTMGASEETGTNDQDDQMVASLLKKKREAAKYRERLKQLDLDWLTSCDAPEDEASTIVSSEIEEESEILELAKGRNEENVRDFQAGYLVTAMSRACTLAFKASPAQRLVLAMYEVELHARNEVLGKMYAVLHKRHAQILDEDESCEENSFRIITRLPIIESFGLANELRKKTSGNVSMPQLNPGGWQVLEADPNLAQQVLIQKMGMVIDPSSSSNLMMVEAAGANSGTADDDEVEELDLDELTAQLTRVRNYVRAVRLRRGLPVHEQLVVHADKQRTLKKNK